VVFKKSSRVNRWEEANPPWARLKSQIISGSGQYRSGSDLVSDQHAIFVNDYCIPWARSLPLPVLTRSKCDYCLRRLVNGEARAEGSTNDVDLNVCTVGLVHKTEARIEVG
jgi:hypothetical protein